MPFFENEGSAPRGKTLPEPVDHNLADVLNPYLQLTCTGIDDGAYRQPDQVIGVGQRIHLVEIVNTPYQPAKLVAPCSKAGDVQIPIANTWVDPPSSRQTSGNICAQR